MTAEPLEKDKNTPPAPQNVTTPKGTHDETGERIKNNLILIMDTVAPGKGQKMGEQLFNDMRKYFRK